MFKNTRCSICLCRKAETINIFRTDLQYVYENLANFKVRPELCFLCSICCRRLQQIVNLQKTAISSQSQKPLVHLSMHHVENGTIPYHIVLPKEEPKEPDIHERCFEYEVSIKREIESTETLHCDEDFNIEENNALRPIRKRSKKEKENQQTNKHALCSVCGKTFADKYSLATHKRTHTGEKPYSCDICQKKFTLAYSLNIHKRAHAGVKPYSCEKCQKKFNTSGYLIKHMRTHTGEKPYVCNTCGLRYRQKNELTVHERRHTGEKPYECKICSKRFFDSSAFAKHNRSHANIRSYACDVCDKSFLRSYTLTEHKRVHKKK